MKNTFAQKLTISPRDGGFRMQDYWVWCGSAIQGEDGRYHLFASRIHKKYLFHPGWTFHSEVVRASSPTPEGPYTFEEVVFGPRESRYFDANATHNPTIFKHGDTYLLFYIGVSFEEDLSDPQTIIDISNDPDRYAKYWHRKRTGLATSKSVCGPWKRPDKPLLEPRLGSWDETIVSNPAPCVLADGSVKLIYKSNRLSESIRGPFRLGLAQASHWSGEFVRAADQPIFADNVEDPYLWHEDGRYWAIMKDMSGAICGEHDAGLLAYSDNCIDWKFTEPPKAYSRTVLWDDRSSSTLRKRERPCLLLQNGRPTHLFNAVARGGAVSDWEIWCMVTPLQ